MQSQIEEKLTAAFSPSHLEVINESHMHSRGTDSHFKVVIVSNAFAGKRLLARHRSVNEALKEELAHYIHALTMHTYTPEEWQQANVPESPKCLGGSKFDS